MSLVSIRTSRVRRYEADERVCRAFRDCIAKPACDVTPSDWSKAVDLLLKWKRLAGKQAYSDPKPVEKAGSK